MANYRAEKQRTVAESGTIDLNRVRIFVKVVEAASFTAAAKALGLPKSSVSRSVTALEEAIGVRLLQRTTRALNLTDAGRAWFAQVRPALQSLDDSTSSVRSLGTEPRGKVRITCPPDSAELISRVTASFRERYPKVQVEAHFASRYVDLVAEGYDLALRAGEMRDSSLIVRKVHDTHLGLYASRAYLKRKGTPKTLADLTRHEAIAFGPLNATTTWHFSGPTGLESVEVPAVAATDLMMFAVRAALDGVGVAILPTMIADAVAEAGDLVRLLPLYRREGNALHVVSPSRAYEPRAVALFKEALLDELQGLTAPRCKAHAREMAGVAKRRRAAA